MRNGSQIFKKWLEMALSCWGFHKNVSRETFLVQENESRIVADSARDASVTARWRAARRARKTPPEITRADGRPMWGCQSGYVVAEPIVARLGGGGAVTGFGFHPAETDFARTIMWRQQSASRLLCVSDSAPDSGGETVTRCRIPATIVVQTTISA